MFFFFFFGGGGGEGGCMWVGTLPGFLVSGSHVVGFSIGG